MAVQRCNLVRVMIHLSIRHIVASRSSRFQNLEADNPLKIQSEKLLAVVLSRLGVADCRAGAAALLMTDL
jgi:hypothetical protein